MSKSAETEIVLATDGPPLLDHGDAHGAGEPSTRTIPDRYVATDATGAPLTVEPVTPTAFVRHRIVREIVVGPDEAA